MMGPRSIFPIDVVSMEYLCQTKSDDEIGGSTEYVSISDPGSTEYHCVHSTAAYSVLRPCTSEYQSQPG